VRLAQQIKRFFIPEINPCLESNFYGTLGDSFQKTADIPTYAKNLGYQRIHFVEHRVYTALAEFITKKRFVAEGACPGTSAGKFKLSAEPQIIGKNMMAMPVRLNVVVSEIERAQGAHVSDRSPGADMKSIFCFKAAARDLMPWPGSQFSKDLIGLAAQGNITSGLANGSGWGG
jgi:hypothetical protein